MTAFYFENVRRVPYLVSYWRLNDISGAGAAIDVGSHNNLNGSYANPALSGPPLIDADDSAASIIFDGGQNVLVPDVAELEITDSMSISAWVSSYMTQSCLVAGKRNVAATIANPYALSLVNGRIQFAVGNGTQQTVCLGPNVPVSIPTQVAARLFRGIITLYLNGEVVCEQDASTQPVTDGGQPLMIGQAFQGLLSEVAFYDGAISNLRVQRDYVLGRQVISDPSHFVTVDPPAMS